MLNWCHDDIILLFPLFTMSQNKNFLLTKVCSRSHWCSVARVGTGQFLCPGYSKEGQDMQCMAAAGQTRLLLHAWRNGINGAICTSYTYFQGKLHEMLSRKASMTDCTAHFQSFFIACCIVHIKQINLQKTPPKQEEELDPKFHGAHTKLQ